MWILEADGDILQNKKIWLRPGKRFLFGRTKTEAGGIAIDNKSISRKHLTIEVANVQPGDGSQLQERSQVTLTDQGSKIGTLLNNEQIRGVSRILDRREIHEIKLGSFQHVMRIQWYPVVFSFSFSSKELKQDDPLSSVRTRLEPLDIKCVVPYIISSVTHTVASKRNTAKGLQALLNAKYIVDHSFVEAVIKAATPSNPEDPDNVSALEEDFESNWPDALQYLPPPGKEPSPRPTEFFAPNPARLNIFEGYTFIFCEKAQIESLQAPISNGGGKTLFFELEYGETTADELVQFVKSVSGGSGEDGSNYGSEGKGVVVVRFRGKKGMEEWSIELGNDVARRLDSRLIEQSEFLDAILVNDASRLRRSLPEPDAEDSFPQPLGVIADSAPQPATRQSSKPPTAAGRSRFRRPVISKFTGFDDDDVDDLKSVTSVIQTQMSPINASHSAKGPSPSQESAMDVDSQPVGVEASQARPSRKRSPPPNDEDEARLMDAILPGATAMKRRRIQTGREGSQVPASAAAMSKQSTARSRGKANSKAQEVDIKKASRGRLEAAEEAARQDEESYNIALDGEDINSMRDLAIVEEMEVKAHPSRANRGAARGEESDRWDERWNGRKNFKKFRRRGVPAATGSRVIVGLEEVKKRGYGIGEEYWINDETQQRRKEKAAVTAREEEGVSSPPLFIEDTPSQPYLTAPSQALDEGDDHVTELDSSRRQPRTTRSSQTKTAPPKRPAGRTFSKPAPSKKQKRLAAHESGSDDSEDEMRFRFKKKT